MTTEQYRKLEYFKLFRLMKNLGYIKSKRKMPSEGTFLNGTKRLYKAFLKCLFPDAEIKTDHSANFTVRFPTANQSSLSNLLNQNRNYFDSLGADGTEALRRATLLKRFSSGYITNYFPSYISIYLRGNDITNRFNNLVNGAVNTFRSSENFFYSAKKCIEFKNLLDEHIPYLVEFERTAEAKRLEQERIKTEAKRQRRQAERERLKLEAEKVPEVKPEVKIKTIEEVKKEAEVKQTAAQLAFNRALEEFKGR